LPCAPTGAVTTLRVLYLTDSLSDLDGVGRYGMRLLAALEAARPGLEVHVLLARKHRPTSDQVPQHWRVEVALPPDYFYYMSPPRYWVWRVLGTWRTWRAARHADLVHAIKDYPHNHLALDGARLAGKPCLATAHGTYTIKPLLSKRHGARARRALAAFQQVIAVSRYTRARLLEQMQGVEGMAERVQVLPNCVDAARYSRPRELQDRPWSGKRFTLSIGEVKERKGHHLALEAWCQVARDHPGLEHFVVGHMAQEGDESAYARRLRDLVAEQGMQSRVHFLGNVTEEEKVDLLQGAEVFVHTPVTSSDGGFEGFGIVYLEASAAGTACLGTLGSGAEDAVQHERTGLLADPTPAAVQAALARLLTDEGLRERMGAEGVQFASESSWDHNAAQVLGLYDAALSS
jgi:glycosyltransferase involved in cell wall biosynthesis